MERELRKCPSCNGDIKLMANPFHYGHNSDCFARCISCKKEYELPTVKLKITKRFYKISKTTIREASETWNLLQDNLVETPAQAKESTKS